jgi:predicted aspartyl protease
MERGLAFAALLWGLAAPAPLPAQVMPPLAPLVATPAAEPTAEEILLEFRDLATRMTVPVTIDRGGPWNFIVDTGSERTAVSRELAQTLGLAAGPDVRVIAISGAEQVPTVLVPALSVSSISARGIVSPAFGARDMGAVGLIGIDALQEHSVMIDFDRQRMTLKPSKKRRRAAGRDDVVVSARSLYGQLIVTDARWRGKRISVVIDTGTPVSMGNPALRRLMTRTRPLGTSIFTSVTGETVAAEMLQADDVAIGGVVFSNLSMAIADAAPFHRFGLADTPALLMGMDMLRLFRNVQIDFANREIRFTLPRRGGIAINGV